MLRFYFGRILRTKFAIGTMCKPSLCRATEYIYLATFTISNTYFLINLLCVGSSKNVFMKHSKHRKFL